MDLIDAVLPENHIKVTKNRVKTDKMCFKMRENSRIKHNQMMVLAPTYFESHPLYGYVFSLHMNIIVVR